MTPVGQGNNNEIPATTGMKRHKLKALPVKRMLPISDRHMRYEAIKN